MPRKRPTIAALAAEASAAFLRLNPHLSVETGKAAAFRPKPGKPAIPGPKHTKELSRLEKCNKTETRFFHEVLMRSAPKMVILPQPPRFFELTGGGTYTPDFLVVTESGPILSIEVKGGYRGPGWDQGYERYKRTALEWDGKGFRFVMATWNAKDKTWWMEAWDKKGGFPFDGPCGE